MKIVINSCHGGFGLSHAAIMRYSEISGLNLLPVKDEKYNFMHYFKNGVESDDTYWYDRSIQRNDPILIQIVEELAGKANGDYANLRIVEIPDDVEWVITEYDGFEHVAEKHRVWY